MSQEEAQQEWDELYKVYGSSDELMTKAVDRWNSLSIDERKAKIDKWFGKASAETTILF